METAAQWPWAEAERESGNAGLVANGLGEISGRQSIQGLLRGWFYYPHFIDEETEAHEVQDLP